MNEHDVRSGFINHHLLFVCVARTRYCRSVMSEITCTMHDLRLREEVDENRDDAESCKASESLRMPSTRQSTHAGKKTRTDLDGNERDDDLLQAFGVPARDRLLEQLQHVLQDLHARVEQVDALRDLEVAPRRVV